MKRFACVLSIILVVGITACFDERDDEYDIIGAVATIAVFEISDDTPSPGEEVTVSFRYYSEKVAVRQLRLFSSLDGDEPVATRDITDHRLEDSYEDSFTYTVPGEDPDTEITLTVEIETANDLVSSESGTITVQ